MHCIPLTEATSAERVGGKALNLARAGARGFRVPQSCVVPCDALREVLVSAGLAGQVREYLDAFGSESASVDDRRHAELVQAFEQVELAAEVEQAIRAGASGIGADRLVVRSSAVCEDAERASFAGVFESVVDVSEEEVVAAVRAVWASLWAPRVVRYARRMGVEPTVDGMAVIIQALVPAEHSGVVYTADPDTGDPFTMVIQEVSGLSVDLMSGSGRADVHRVAWDADLPVARVARGLDEAWRTRVDVEWAVTDGEPWVVQVRPMTTVPEHFPVELTESQKTETWQIPMFVMPVRGDLPPGLITPLYADMSESELWFRYQPEDIVLTGVWKHTIDVNGYRYAAATKHETFLDYFDDPLEFEPWLLAHDAHYRERWDQRHAEVRSIAEDAAAAVQRTTTAAELIPAMLSVRDRLWDLASFGWSGPQALGWMCEGLLPRLVEGVVPDLDAGTLLGGSDTSFTYRVAKALQDLGRSIDEPSVVEVFERCELGAIVPALLADHADSAFMRAYEAYCWEMGKCPPSWGGRPSFWFLEHDLHAMRAIRGAVQGTARDVEVMQRAAAEGRVSAEKATRDRIAASDESLLDRFDRALAWTRYWTQALNDRHGLGLGLLHERELIWQVGVRLATEGVLAAPEDVLALRAEDLRAVADGSAATTLGVDRVREFERSRRFTAPATLGVAPDPPAPAPPGDAAQTDGALRGTGICGGTVKGRVRKVHDLLDVSLLDALTEEDVLVLPHANSFVYADWHSLFTLVRGVVSPGAPGHHLVQVARECGVPLVGHVIGDLDALENGAAIEIDGRSGAIVI